jgi:murein DD-endopeptidase MepM/ murein hydrolase activator NlpD
LLSLQTVRTVKGVTTPYPAPDRLQLPLEPYTTGDYHTFGKKLRYKLFLSITHLGDDLVAAVNTPINAIGVGHVVYADTRPGSATQPNWGGLVIIGHTHLITQQPFYSVYGHLYKLAVRAGDQLKAGHTLGLVAPGNSSDNGWWKIPHLHFAIYTGPWTGQVLPGYHRPTRFWRTRLSWWQDPQAFVTDYNKV